MNLSGWIRFIILGSLQGTPGSDPEAKAKLKATKDTDYLPSASQRTFLIKNIVSEGVIVTKLAKDRVICC